MNVPPAMVPNRPTEEGRELGAHLARFADDAVRSLKADGVDVPERCASCAFRQGSVPNGCAPTLMDALKCLLEGKTFFCHCGSADAPHACAGYAAIVAADGDRSTPVRAPWSFTMGGSSEAA